MKLMLQQRSKGFIALVAVMMMAIGVLTFCLVASASALAYSDMVMRREMRIQAGYDLRSCLETLTIMLAKDFYMSGYVYVEDFGCETEVENPGLPGTVRFYAITTLNGIKARGYREIQLTGDSLTVISTKTD